MIYYDTQQNKNLFCSNIFIKNSHFHLVSTLFWPMSFQQQSCLGQILSSKLGHDSKLIQLSKKRWRIIVLFKSQRSSIRCISQEHTIFAVLRSIRLHSFPRSTIFTEIYHRIDRKNSKNYFIISIRKQVIGQSYDKTNCSMLLTY